MSDLRQELQDLKRITFGPTYDRIRRHLDDVRHRKRKEFQELEDYFFHMVTYILSTQHTTGWWYYGHDLQNVITAHAVRHLHKLGISLKARWNSDDPTDKQGNLFRAVKLLINCYGQKPTHSYWGTDVWDDCYILLALFEVQSELDDEEVRNWDPTLKPRFQDHSSRSLNWLKNQFGDNGFVQNITKEAWFGPGFYAAAIEVFSHPDVKKRLGVEADKLVGKLAGALGTMIEESFTAKEPKWHSRFAWHAGQVLVTWKEKRESYGALAELDGLMDEVFHRLKERQSENGAWDNNGQVNDVEYQVYYTVRALAACYVNIDDMQIPESEHIVQAHQFLLKRFEQGEDGGLVNTKASINALGAFQKLFEFHVHDIFPNVLISLTARLNELGLLEQILSPGANDADTLKRIRESARRQLEKCGVNGLELLGVNGQLYTKLEGNSEFLKEFTGDRSPKALDKERAEILEDLRRCLSATLTETRSKLSHRLIMRLWDTDGFLNFKPLIEHLSVLEQDRAFYKYYRDHLNHELLLFLLGAYIYYNCATFRDKVDDEISRIYENYKMPFSRKELAGEFLFRWKLISTFHDIGYLFEVDPFKDKSTNTTRTKTELIEKSWQVVDGFREQFLYDYFLHTVERSDKPGLDAKEAQTAHEQEVKELAANIGAKLNPYPGEINGEGELLKLFTVDPSHDPFTLMSQFIKCAHIGPNLIKNYFYLCGAMPVLEEKKDGTLEKQRDPFYDHGIMSALILLKSIDIQRHYLSGLRNEETKGTLLAYPQLGRVISKQKAKAQLNAEQFFIRFSHVAGAIALHNIWPSLYRREQCAEFDTTPKRTGEGIEQAFYPDPSSGSERYLISLDENPLSYLTALADTLQDWDRHSFRRLSFTDDSDPLTSSELTMDFEESKINVRPLTEAARQKYTKLTAPNSLGHLSNWEHYLKIS